MTRFTYYVVRVTTGAGAVRDALTGVVERLASGEKQSFVTGADLVSVITIWSTESNMQSE